MRTVAFHNLGCKVNSYEIEVMQQNFQNNGYEIVPFDTKADIYVVNTCTVTNIADRKSRQMLHRARKLNPDAVVVATGCYVQTSPDRAIADDAIDICIGNNRKNAIIEIVEEHLSKIEKQKLAGDTDSANKEIKTEDIIDIGSTDISVGYEDMLLTDTAERVRAYIKIQDGCNQFCSYCAIPLARGRVRSRRRESILDEIKGLTEKGFKEFVLTGIHISSYGMDFIDKNSEDYLGNKDVRDLAMKKEYLLNLIKEVADIEGVKRIRLGSLEPRIITDRFASKLAGIEKICPHFHLSMQSGCDETLKRMNRHYTCEEYMSKVEILRQYFDNPAITTDVIVGFPGENEEEFNRTVKFIREVQFYETHIFKYSPRKGTVAAGLPGQLTDKVKSGRSDVLEAIDRQAQSKYRALFEGKASSILIEEEKQIGNDIYLVGHTPNYIMAAVYKDRGSVGKIVQGRLSSINDSEIMLLS